jgi:hypothetical protein
LAPESSDDDGNLKIPAQQRNRKTISRTSDEALKLGDGVHALAVDGIDDIARPEPGLPRAAALLDRGHHETTALQALEERAATLDFHDGETRELRQRAPFHASECLGRGDTRAYGKHLCPASDPQRDFLTDQA